ncbi:hypothetical protein KP509_12G036800 [Ceratopteris richardii]|nr:hypothetical protein KP509_12G036800 [Ceratopteris richardii]
MYAKCGALEKAQEAFDGFPIKNIVSWNALIAGYVQHNRCREALNCFKCMQGQAIAPDKVTFSCILKACGSIAALDKGQELHAELLKRGLLEHCVVVGNALIDMYVKCGHLAKAREVFDELPTIDVITWTTLMTGYVLEGHGEEALRLYERMKETTCLPNAATFLGILKACSSMQAVQQGLQVHSEIISDGSLEKDMVVGTAIIDMYAKCSMMMEAQDVFDELPIQDSLLWSTLIDGYAQNMQGQEALNCFEQMQIAGFRADEVTLASVLKACGSVGAVNKGEEIHHQLNRDKLIGSDPVVRNALIGMYSKCGLYAKAWEVFNETPKRDIVAWNALISGYVLHKYGREAIECFEDLVNEGLCPDDVTFVSVLKACGIVGDSDLGQRIHAMVVKEGLLDHFPAIANALVYMYAKCKSLEKASYIFKELKVRDSVSWNSLIARDAQDVYGKDAINMFQQMQADGIPGDAVTFARVLKACASTGAVEKGEEIHNQILLEGVAENSQLIFNSLIGMYAKCGLMSKAQEVFDKLPVKDVVSWNALIAGYVQQGLPLQALNCFEQMQLAGQVPDSITYTSILKACANTGALKKGEAIHAEAMKGLFTDNDVRVGTALVDLYAKCGLLEKAKEAFNKLPYHDVISWNALITGYVQHALEDEALSCFKQMHFDGVLPDDVSFVCMLKVCGSLGAVFKGYEMHAEIIKKGCLEKGSTIVSALVDMYANCGLSEEAREVFDKLSIRDTVDWNALIAGYALLGQDQDAFHMLCEMLKQGSKPDLVTFTTILNVCSHVGLLEKGEKFFQVMLIDHQIEPTLKHFTCLVDLYARAGQLDKGEAVILKLPFQADAAVWNALLGASHSSNDAKVSAWAYKHVELLELCDASTYVPFRSISAAA